jgi:predicted nucleic acid-binding protein
MAARYLLDTDVLVEYLRGSPKAIRYIERLEGELLLSAITVAELFSGARGEEEETALEQFLQVFEVMPVGQDLARRGGLYRRDYGRSHGTGLADALIAASAEAAGAVFVTFNRRHYPMTSPLKVPYRRG